MEHQKAKRRQQLRRRRHVRRNITGTAERPRLTVFRSSKHIYAQLVDDLTGATLAAASTTAEDVRGRLLGAEVILPTMERVKLNVEQEAMVRQGRSVRVLPEPGPGLIRAHDAGGRLVALGHTDPLRRTFVPEKVLT